MTHNVESILRYFTEIRKAYANRLQLQIDGHNLTPNEISVLILLSQNPSIDTAGQCCMLLGVSKSLVSRSVDSLSEKGLLSSVKDEKDKRIVRLKLTEKSSPVLLHMTEQIDALNHSLLQSIPMEELLQMKKTMSKILSCFERKEDPSL